MVERLQEEKKEDKVSVQEVEIDLTLINNKLNHIINLMQTEQN